LRKGRGKKSVNVKGDEAANPAATLPFRIPEMNTATGDNRELRGAG